MPVDRIQEIQEVVELLVIDEISEEEAREILKEKGYDDDYIDDQLWRAGFGEEPK